jgi:hypothetical protein
MRIMRFVVLALTAFLLTSAWAAPKMSGTSKEVKRGTATISVGTDNHGGLVFTPHKLVIRKSLTGTVVWRCSGYKIFTLDFGWASPFPEISYSVQDGEFGLDITSDFPEGRFPYFVAVWDEANHRIITSDPDLIIRK